MSVLAPSWLYHKRFVNFPVEWKIADVQVCAWRFRKLTALCRLVSADHEANELWDKMCGKNWVGFQCGFITEIMHKSHSYHCIPCCCLPQKFPDSTGNRLLQCLYFWHNLPNLSLCSLEPLSASTFDCCNRSGLSVVEVKLPLQG